MKKLVLALFLVSTNVFGFWSDVEKSWNSAHVYYPGATEPRTIKELDTLSKQYPVIVYMHGCAGLYVGQQNAKWGQSLANKGYVVVQPDSMARSGRVPNCDPDGKRATGNFRNWAYYREQEIDYALEQVQNSSWGKPGQVYLMGFSEGAIATALYSSKGFKAHVIMGWTCTSSQYTQYDGIRSPKEVPILVINRTVDPWFANTSFSGNCVSKASGRSVTNIVLPGEGHGTFGKEQLEEVDKFLKGAQ